MAEIFYAFYDLRSGETNFDFSAFLALADRERRRQKHDSLHLVIVASTDDKGSHPGHWSSHSYDEQHRIWRIHNLLIPMSWRVEAIKGVSLCWQDEDTHLWLSIAGENIFPCDYTFEHPTPKFWDTATTAMAGHLGEELDFFTASAHARALVANWLGSTPEAPPYVATLRESAWQADCNSEPEIWVSALCELAGDDQEAIVLRDMETVMAPPSSIFGPVRTCAMALFSIDIRLALYEIAELSLFAANGPAALAGYDAKCRFIVFMTGYWSENLDHPHAQDGAMVPLVCNGIGLRRTPPHYPRHQTWLWETPDSSAELAEAVRRELRNRREGQDSHHGPEPILTVGMRYFNNSQNASFLIFCDFFLKQYSAATQSDAGAIKALLALHELNTSDPQDADAIRSHGDFLAEVRSADPPLEPRDAWADFSKKYFRLILDRATASNLIGPSRRLIQQYKDCDLVALEDLRLLADLYLAEPDLNEAREILETITERYPMELALRLKLAVVHEQTSRWADALNIYDSLISLGAKNPELLARRNACEKQIRHAENMETSG
jgi:hypothetical protein